MRVLITQAEQDAETTATALRARGHEVLSAPVLSTERTPSPKIDLAGAQGFVVTGEEGARALAHHIGVRTFPVFTDSDVTAATLRSLGFKSVFAAKDDYADLARLIERSVKSNAGALIHACSTQPAVHLGALLGNNGFALRPLPLYSIRRANTLPPDVLAALKNNTVDAALFLSPEEARAFVALAQQASLGLTGLAAVAATPAVAASLRALKLRAVTVPSGAGVAGAIDALDGALVDKVAEERRAAEARMREEAERLRVQEEAEARAKAEAEAVARETAERERLKQEAAERARQERLAQERAATEQARAEKEKRAAEDTERKRVAEIARAEETERERQRREAARAQTEAERQARAAEEAAQKEAAERARQERLARERAAAEQARAESERQAAVERERKRIAAEQTAATEVARRQGEALRLAHIEEENVRRAKDIADRKRAQAEFAAAERAAAARREQEMAAASDQIMREQEAAERAAQERAATLRDTEALALREQQKRRAAEKQRLAAEAEERADREQAETAMREAERAAQEHQRRVQDDAARMEALRVRDAAIRAEDDARTRAAEERKRLEAERRAEERAAKKAENARLAEEKRAQRAAEKEQRRQAERDVKRAATGARRWWHAFARTEKTDTRPRGKWDMPLAETAAHVSAPAPLPPKTDALPPSYAPDLSSSEASATMTLAALGELITSKPQHTTHPAATTEHDMDVSPEPEQQSSPESAPPDPQPTARTDAPARGGRAAQLLAEDAADDKAQAQRLRHFGASETNDTESESTESTPARRRGGWRAATLFIVLLAVTATVFKTAPHWVPRVTALLQTPTAPSAQIAETQVPASTPQPVPQPVTPREAPTAQETKPAPAVSSPTPEPTALGETLASQAQQVAALTARVATLEAALGNSARLDEMNQRLGALEGKAADASSVLALSQRVAALENTERRAAAAQATAVAFLTALGQWREALAAGRPFTVELETVKALAGTTQVDDSGFVSYARDGLPTAAELERRFEPISVAVVRASLIPDTTSSWLRRVLDRVMMIVTVRRTDDTTGAGTTAVVARAEHRLAAADLDGATRELQGLQGAAAEAAAPWLAQARARSAADRVLDDATSKALAALAAAQKPVEPTP